MSGAGDVRSGENVQTGETEMLASARVNGCGVGKAGVGIVGGAQGACEFASATCSCGWP